jgi:surfactin family lipopeptide synthetase A
MSTDQAFLQQALANLPSVADCAVLQRETENAGMQWVAYVVPTGPFVPEEWAAHLQTALLDAPRIDAFVPLATLPLTSDGQVDEAALLGLEVIDPALSAHWEEAIQAISEVQEVAVVAQDLAETSPPLHLADLLLDWKTAAGNVSASEAAIPAAEARKDAKGRLPSLSVGPPLATIDTLPPTLPDALRRTVERHPDHSIICTQLDGPDAVLTYSDLLQQAQRILAGLRSLGLQAGDKALFQFEHNQDFLAALWGCFLGGIIPVPLAIAPTYDQPNTTTAKLYHAWEMLGGPVVLTNRQLAGAVASLSALHPMDGLRALAIEDLRRHEPDSRWHASRPDDVALMLLTSGSTGKPKAVMQSHRAILFRSAATAQMNDFSDREVSLNWLPLDHVGGLVMFHLHDLVLGCKQVHVPTQAILRSPLVWLDLIERHRVMLTWAPNFAYGLINTQAEAIARRHWDLSSLHFILNGGEAIVARTSRRFLEVLAPHGLPATAMHPAWGMSETCSGVTFSHAFQRATTSDEDPFVEVGGPIPGFSMRIVDGQDQVIEEGQIGSLQVKGPMVTSGYYDNPSLNSEVLHDGWMTTGDLGVLHDGRLTITGRQKDVIIINGINFYSHEIEAVVEEVPGVEVSFTAACAVREGGDTDSLAIFFHTPWTEPEKVAGLLKEVRGRVVRNLGVSPTHLLPVAREDIPKTEIGKIQRAQLRQRFEAGEFASVLKQVDIISGNANTLPDWFYRVVWRPKAAATVLPLPAGTVLLFQDANGLGATLCSRLDQPCVRVEAGEDFAQVGRLHYRICPTDPRHYSLLLSSLSEDNLTVDQVVHLWSYGPSPEGRPGADYLRRTQELGAYSLLLLAQALSAGRLLMISSHTQATGPKDKVSWPKAPLLGLINAISQEMSGIDCRHVDLPLDHHEVNVARIVQELRCTGDREVAYRGSSRLVPRLQKVAWAPEQRSPLPFKRGGMYLLTGGLGGIGVEIARYLLDHYQARLLLVGRTSLPQDGGATPALSGIAAERLAALGSLRQQSAKVSYVAADVCDPERLAAVVAEAEAGWQCRLDGVLHLAGTLHERSLAEETCEGLAEVLRPKVLGTWSIEQLLQDRPGALFIGFSSVMSFFAPALYGAYAAANRALDAFTHQQGPALRKHCFAWSAWAEIGMNRQRDGKAPLRLQGRGFEELSAEQGVHSLIAGLQYNHPRMLIGLDGSKPLIRRHLEGQSCQGRQLRAYFTTGDGPIPLEQLQAVVVRDRFGTPSACQFLQVAQMPRTAAGEIDRDALTGPRPQESQRVAPRTETEARTAAIWQEVLGVPAVGIHDNFFELGGHSLLATQVLARLNDAFHVELPVTSLFQAGTVAELAERIEAVQGAFAGPTLPPVVSVARKSSLPLSFAQQRLWFFEQLTPGLSSYNLPSVYRIHGNLDVVALQKSFSEIVRRHEALRTIFPAVDGRPYQRICPPAPVPLEIVDLQHLPRQEREAAAHRLASEEIYRPFDLAQGPLLRTGLLRLAADEHLLLVTTHHIVFDGWSTGTFSRELAALYEALTAGRPSPLLELPIQFADYAVWEQEHLQGPALDAELTFWKQHLAGVPALLELPADRPRPAVQSYRGTHRTFALSPELSAKLKDLSAREGVTLFMTLMAAFQALLYRYASQEHFLVSTGVANRDRRETEPLIGCLINILLVKADLSGSPSFRELLQRVRQNALAAFAHPNAPFEKLVEALGVERDLSYHPLTQVMLVLIEGRPGELQLRGLAVELVDIESTAIENDIVVHVLDTPEGLTGYIDYSTDLFDHETIGRMIGHFQVLLEGVAADADRCVLDLPLLTAAERQQVLVEWNNTGKDYPADRCLHELFEVRAAAAPDAPAVLFGDQCLSYGELDRRANQLAHYLRKLGVGPDVLVGLSVERSFEMVVGILGIMKAGGAYVPLDPAYPRERLRLMMQDTRAPVLLTQAHLRANLEGIGTRTVFLDADAAVVSRESTERPASDAGPDRLSYVIYTSGSTGKPKGISIRHRGVVNNIVDLNWRHGVGPSDRVLAISSLSFDMCVYEVFGTLEAGGAIVMPEPDGLREPSHWAELIQRHRVTIWNSAPALLKMLVDHVSDRPELWPRHLHLSILGGDWCPLNLGDRLKAMAPQVRFVVLGGATEASIHSIIYTVEKIDPKWKSIPYGHPQYNQKAYILNPRLQPVPVGVPGELYLGGIGLGRGYFRRPGQTAERFLPSPFAEEPGERIYKTGDLARWMPDGNIELLGRMDYQVKLRGLRIECGEIEALIRRHHGVREVVVVAQGDKRGDKRLVAFVRPNPKTAAAICRQLAAEKGAGDHQQHGPTERNGSTNGQAYEAWPRPDALITDLRGYLRNALPDYMVPSVIVLVTELPLSPNGKVDRKALSQREVAGPRSEKAFVPPRTPEEEILVRAYGMVLGREGVGIYDNFFDLGGHSLLATQVLSQVRDAFQIEVPLRAFFEAPTVAGLAEVVRKSLGSGATAQSPPLAPMPRGEQIPVSSGQRGLWFIDQLSPGTSSYSIPLMLRLSGELHHGALARTLAEVVRRHEVLRTVYLQIDGEPVQQVQPPDAFRMDFIDISLVGERDRPGREEQLVYAESQRPFDLERGPMFRATLVQCGPREHLLLLTTHHIAADGWSLGVLGREMAALYETFSVGQGPPLAEPAIQYADYAIWQQQWLASKAFEEQAAYWKEQLTGAPTKLELPADHPRPPDQTFRGARYFFTFPNALLQAAEKVSREQRATLFMTLLAGFETFLNACTGREDILLGSPFANRAHTETEGIIGDLVNTVVLRTSLAGRPTFRQLLGHVRDVVLGASANQELPFEKLVELLQPPRDPSRNPVFQVNFRVQTEPLPFTLTGLACDLRINAPLIAKFDLAAELWAHSGSFRGYFEYSTDLFEPATIATMVKDFEHILQAVLHETEVPLGELAMVQELRARTRPVTAPQKETEAPKRRSVREARRKGIDLGG